MNFYTKEQVIALTPLWKGERFDDGRPKVSDAILERFRHIILEEAWDPMNMKYGYPKTYQMGLKRTHMQPEKEILVGRAYTCAMLPTRQDYNQVIMDYGTKMGFKAGQNQWVVDALQPGDVGVIDLFGKIKEGTFVGGNLAKAVAYNTKGGGLVVWGGIRDVGQIRELDELQIYYVDDDASGIRDVTLSTVNGPVRVGDATCLPGDVVYATAQGVLFIPPHIAEEVVAEGEKTHFKDEFCFQRLDEGTYRIHEVHSVWRKDIFEDFLNWFKTAPSTKNFQYLTFEEDRERIEKWWAENSAAKNNGDYVVI
ncbi:MAG: RraA family protein [Christensenellaceae bacterium]|nr:RraA family protein [Christensenellaceae bacterium]